MRPKHWLFTIPLRLRSLFRRGQADQELDDELRDHLERRTEEYVAKGMAQEEAHRRASLDLQGIEQTKEKCRDARRVSWMQDFVHDLRYGLRMLRKSPGFTAVGVLTLALGIGANTAIFSVVNAVLLRPLPFKDPGRLADLWRYDLKLGVPQDQMSYPDFLDLRNQNTVFSSMAAFCEQQSIVLTSRGEPERIPGTICSSSLFDVIGVSPALGRAFLPAEDQPGKGNTVILSHEFSRTHFNSDQSALGQSLRLDGTNYQVIGVMPPGFTFPISADPVAVWLTVATDGDMATGRGVAIYNVITRLKPGITAAQATAQTSTLFKGIAARFPRNHAEGWNVRVVPTRSDLVSNSRDALLVLFAAVGMVLLIACANVANLILSRGTARRYEIALRTALGASRFRVVRQLLTESLLLALCGGALGLAAGYWATVFLVRTGPQDIPRLTSVHLDAPVFLFALAVSVLTSVLFGLVPALRVSKLELTQAVNERGQSGPSSRSRFRSALIVAEVALSLVTVLGAGLLLQTLWHLEKTHPGFDPNRVLTFSLELPGAFSDPQRVQYLQELLPRLRFLPGVDSASAVFPLPFLTGMGITTRFQMEGSGLDPNQWPRADLAAIDDSYFRSMRIPLLQGQDFLDAKAGPSRPVAVVNEAFARRYFRNENPIGKRLKPDVETTHTPAQLAEIIGIVANVKTSSLRQDAAPLVYVPFSQFPISAMTLVLRSGADPRPLVAAVRQETQAVNPAVLIFNGKTLEQEIGLTLGQPRFNALLLAVFAGLALALAMVGLYGAISYAVSQRTQEIGIRMALGAAPVVMMKLMLGSGLRLALVGTALGLAAAFVLARLMTGLLFGVSATDPLTFLSVAALLTLVALAACYIPARRAMRVDPLVALRYE
ncbi:MAG TPA: ABC transporter permease [Candidatus Acidoferrum sp.]